MVHLGLKDGIGYHAAFLAVAGRLENLDKLAFFVVRPDFFGYLVLVVCNHAVGGIHDRLGGPVVLFKFNKLVLRVIVLEIQYILDIRATE